jgi:ABC-type transport system involved in multi-copper enzyme maturation permease subunit
MKRVAAIAFNTFREAMRDKLLYTILFFACLIILSALALGQLSLHEELRVTRDIGLAGISLFGVVLAIFAGVTMVYKEIERKTLYALIPKPLQRWHFVVGKFFGLAITLFVQVALMAIVLGVALIIEGAFPDGAMVRAVILLYGQVLVVTAVAILFSTFSTPFLSGLFTAGLFIIGRSTPELRTLITTRLKDSPTLATALVYALNVVPDLHLFFVSGGTVAGKTVSVNAGDYVSWGYVGSASGYGALYAGCVLLLAVLIFSRRDFV